MDPATLALIAGLLGFIRDAGIVGVLLLAFYGLATGKAFLRRAHDDALKGKDDIIAIERERTKEALAQRDSWRRAAETAVTRVDALTKSVDVLAGGVEDLVKGAKP